MAIKTKLGEAGRVVIPAEYRRALGLRPGDDLILSLEGDTIRLRSIDAAIQRAQELVRKYVPEGVSLSDELIAERHAEAQRE